MKPSATIPLVLVLTACSPAPQHADTGGALPSAATSAPGAPNQSPPASTAAAPVHAPDAPRVEPAAMLLRYHWQLASAVTKDGQPIAALNARPDQPLQLDFKAGALSISNTCNRMRGRYTLAGNTLELGPLAATLMACPNPTLEALDRAVPRYLHGALTFATDASEASPQLVLTTEAGDKLVFTGILTRETRYGSSGTTEFLEIAPQPQRCNDPTMPGARCLEVRELHYDTQGLRTGTPGAWHLLSQPIQGFTHTPGTRNVLRVTRFGLANPPGDAPSAVYVLDLVVESEAPASH